MAGRVLLLAISDIITLLLLCSGLKEPERSELDVSHLKMPPGLKMSAQNIGCCRHAAGLKEEGKIQ